jgi:hypothetical protein
MRDLFHATKKGLYIRWCMDYRSLNNTKITVEGKVNNLCLIQRIGIMYKKAPCAKCISCTLFRRHGQKELTHFYCKPVMEFLRERLRNLLCT